MATSTGEELKQLQRLDEEIENARRRVSKYDPLLAEVEEPALILESEAENTRSRLKEMKVEERRVEGSADDKRNRMEMLQKRLNEVRNVREEAAVQAELDMVRRALEADEQEALTLLDQIRKLEDRLEEQEAALAEAREEVEPRRNELLSDRDEARATLEELRERRGSFAEAIEDGPRRVYERIRSGGRDVAVAELTFDGACGHCYGMVPLQVRNEIGHGGEMIRCEACGVILTPHREEIDEGPAADVQEEVSGGAEQEEASGEAEQDEDPGEEEQEEG